MPLSRPASKETAADRPGVCPMNAVIAARSSPVPASVAGRTRHVPRPRPWRRSAEFVSKIRAATVVFPVPVPGWLRAFRAADLSRPRYGRLHLLNRHCGRRLRHAFGDRPCGNMEQRGPLNRSAVHAARVMVAPGPVREPNATTCGRSVGRAHSLRCSVRRCQVRPDALTNRRTLMSQAAYRAQRCTRSDRRGAAPQAAAR